MDQDKLKLLKSLHLLDEIPEKDLPALGKLLKPTVLKIGQVLFEQGSKGTSLFFVVSGHIVVAKQLSGKTYKDLAVLGPGDCFGEMALLEETARSARATATEAATVLELARKDLDKFLETSPNLVMQFFAGLVQVQSRRLRRTSNELAMLSDLSSLLLDRHAGAPELMGKVLSRILPHLGSEWSAAAYLYNPFNDEMDFVAREGVFDAEYFAGKLPPAAETRSLWVDAKTYYVSLPGAQRPLGHLIFGSQTPLDEEAKIETGRTLTMVARLITSAIENIAYRSEELLRARLKTTAHGASL